MSSAKPSLPLWRPPTPQSILVPMPAPPPPLQSFDPLPPPLLAPTHQRHAPPSRISSGSVARLLNDSEETSRATPSTFTGEFSPPTRGYFEEKPSAPHVLSDQFAASTSASMSSSNRKRPRRAAASRPLVPRQPSPLSLSPPASNSSLTHSQSNRKVSHSLIERRRREKINDCLSTLKTMVPQCREEGERKERRARERGRKRGRGEEEEEGSRGGLHKLEILQGTILYIEELEARLATFVAHPSPSPSPSPALSSPSSDSLISSSLSSAPTPTYDPARLHSTFPPLLALNQRRNSTEEELAADAAGLLLGFSTSPELRPVFFAE